jgi:lysophospholipid acyltransferase (LPLAT)-like uncharacterized protein
VHLGKGFLSSPLALALTGVFVRVYRAWMYAGFLLRHDRAMLALMKSRDPVVLVCWHQDFAPTLGTLARAHPRRRTHPLASASRDGALAAAAASGVGFAPAVRGSSAGGGARALLRLRRLARGGAPSFVVVGDGPRPPARSLKPGAVRLAGETGLPIWLVRTSWHPDNSLSWTWARFHLPRPFGRGVAVADGPIHVPRGLDREGTEAARRHVEARLEALARRGDALARRLFGGEPGEESQPGPAQRVAGDGGVPARAPAETVPPPP